MNKVFLVVFLRLFNRGHREEEVVYNDLKMIGCEIVGDQYKVNYGNYIYGHCDGVIRGLPTCEKTWHLLEIKTVGDKYYKKYFKDGLEKTNIVYYTQMQCYMYLMELERGLFFAVNKNTDEIYTERIKLDKDFAIKQLDRAERIIDLTEPPNGISDNPSWFECKFCSAHQVCYKKTYPQKNCRTCVYSTPTKKGWTCDKTTFGEVCDEHLYIPSLISEQYEIRDDGCVWHCKDNKIIVNAKTTGFPQIQDNIKIDEVI